MKPITFAIIIVGMAALVLTVGCGRSLSQRIEQAKGNAAEEQKAEEKATVDAQSDYLDEWQAFAKDAEKQITKNAQSMDELKTKAAASDEKFKAHVNAAVEDLAARNRVLKDKLNGYKDEGKVNWDMFKRDFSREMDGVDKALSDLEASDKK